MTILSLALTLNPLTGRAEITSPEVNLDQQDPMWRHAMQRGLDTDSLDRGTTPVSGERLRPHEPPVLEFLREYSRRYPELAVGRPGGRPKRQAQGDQTASLEADLRFDLQRVMDPLGMPALEAPR